MAKLPETLQVAVNLIYHQGLKYREAAEILKVPVGTVKSRLHRALQRLAWPCNRPPNPPPRSACPACREPATPINAPIAASA